MLFGSSIHIQIKIKQSVIYMVKIEWIMDIGYLDCTRAHDLGIGTPKVLACPSDC